MTDTLFDYDDGRKDWQKGGVAYPGKLYAGEPPSEPKDEAGTSRAAGSSVKLSVGSIREGVLRCIRSAPDGLTDDDLEMVMMLRHQTVSARRRELVLLGLIKDSGQRRNTRSGRKAAVWIVA